MYDNVTYNILFLGDLYVGKTSIIDTFLSNKFNKNQEITIGVSFFNKKIKVKKKIYNIRIWDTTGDKKYINLFFPYYKIAELVIIVYDLTNINSFKNVKYWLNSVKEINNKCKIIAIGNKSDLKNIKILDSDIKKFTDIDITHQKISAKNVKSINNFFCNIIENI